MNKNFGGIENKYWYFILGWFIFNLFQAAFTFLHFDEAYYNMYSQHLSWGYFDHPPVVSVVCWLGHALFPGEFGLRFVHVLLSAGTMYFLIRLLRDKLRPFYVILVILSFPLTFFHISGFLAIPDTALLFFSMWFLFQYRRFLQKQTLGVSVLLAAAAAMMVLSKYHGGILLVILFISNSKLFFNRYAWLAVAIVVGCLLPHLYWQYANDFPSFSYHLSQRVDGFYWENVFDYTWSQLALAGFFTSWMVVYALWVFKPADEFEKGLKFIAAGFWLFFLIMSFRDNMEAHWTAIAMPAMMYVLADLLARNEKMLHRFKRLAVPAVLLVFIGRALLFKGMPSFPPKSEIMDGWDDQVALIDEKANGIPVVFSGSYKLGSLYRFYSPNKSTVVPEFLMRYTQYDLLHEDEYLVGKKVLVVSQGIEDKDSVVLNEQKTVGCFVVDSFATYRKLTFSGLTYKIADSVTVSGLVTNLSTGSAGLTSEKYLKPHVAFEAIGDDGWPRVKKIVSLQKMLHKQQLKAGESAAFSINVPVYECEYLRMQVRFIRFRGDEFVMKMPH